MPTFSQLKGPKKLAVSTGATGNTVAVGSHLSVRIANDS